MEVSKWPLEKIFAFVAGIIPGALALYIQLLSSPIAPQTLQGLGYNTKVALFLCAAFIIGNTLSMFLGAVSGGIGGMYGYFVRNRLRAWELTPTTAPWRAPSWRSLAKAYLGIHAPNDTMPLSEQTFTTQMQLIAAMPEEQRREATQTLMASKAKLANDDFEWGQWFVQIEQQRLSEEALDLTKSIQQGLLGSQTTSALYLLGSFLVVPATRHWYCYAYCALWISFYSLTSAVELRKIGLPWQNYPAQVIFLGQKTKFGSPNPEPSVSNQQPASH